MAVAQFGQLALEGTDIDELTDEATALMQRVLDIDIGGVLKLLPGGDELLLISAAGLPEEDVGRTRVATGHQSQSGYALATGLPIVVNDWHTENRFRESKLQADAGMRSAVTVLIKAKGDPYGVLGVGSRTPRKLTQDDVSFMQSIANVLRTRSSGGGPRSGPSTRRSTTRSPASPTATSSSTGSSTPSRWPPGAKTRSPCSSSTSTSSSSSTTASVTPRATSCSAPSRRIEQALRPGDTVARFGATSSPSWRRTSAASAARRESRSGSRRLSRSRSCCATGSTS